MGALLSSLLSLIFRPPDRYPPLGTDADVVDPSTGLTPRQARAVLVTWDMVRPNMKEHGINFFIKLFKDSPPIQKYFKAFDNKSPDDLRSDKRLAAHAHTVMLSISGIVDNLGDMETLCNILKTTGRNHRNRGIKKENFVQLRVTLLSFLEESLGDAFTPEAKQGWTIATAAINAVIFQAYDNIEEE